MEKTAELTSAATARQVHCNGLAFPLLTWGHPRARPVLLLHGFPQEPFTWSAVAEALAREGLYALAPFQRGYAATARPQSAASYTFSHFVHDAIAIADDLGLDRSSAAPAHAPGEHRCLNREEHAGSPSAGAHG